MATTSVIEIEIIDEKFKAFDAQLKAMQALIAQLPAQWKKVTKEVNEEQKAEKKATNEAEKARRKRLQEEKEYNKILENRKKAFMDVSYSTLNIAKNLASGAVSIAKWATFGAIGGGFGLGALASSATGYRTQGRIAGASSGQLRALETYLEPSLPGAGSILEKLEEMRTDRFEQYKLGSLGGAKLSSFELLGNLLQKAGESYKRTGTTNEFLWRNPTLEGVINPAQIRAFGGLPEREQQDVLKRLKSNQFAVDDQKAATWQRFWEQLKAAGNYIETAFLKNLDGVAIAFTSLSKAIAETIEKVLQNKQVQEFLTKTLPDAIKSFADYLTSPEFRTDLDDFFSAIREITTWIGDKLQFFGIISEKKLHTSSEDIAAAGGDKKKADWLNTQRRTAIDYWMAHGATQAEAIGLAANFEAESTWNSGVKTYDSKGRLHYGRGQWDPERQADFLAWKGHSIFSSKDEEQNEFALYELLHKKKNVLAEMRAKANPTYKDTTAILARDYEIFGNDPKEFKRREDIASRIAVDLHVREYPGSNLTVAANTLR